MGEVVKVIGTVDSVPVILEHKEGNIWQVPVPLDQDGEYVVEIIAEDDAGNRAYLAKLLFVVNTSLLCVHVLELPYYGQLLDRNYYAELIEPICPMKGGW